MKTKKSTKKRLFKIFNCISALSAVAGCFFIPDLHWICLALVSIIAANIWIVSILSEVKNGFNDNFLQFLSPWGIALIAIFIIYLLPISVFWCLIPIGLANFIGCIKIKSNEEISIVSTLLVILIVAYTLVPTTIKTEASNNLPTLTIIGNNQTTTNH